MYYPIICVLKNASYNSIVSIEMKWEMDDQTQF